MLIVSFPCGKLEKKYTITYVLGGGTNAETNPNQIVDTQTINLADATRYGHTFDGWYLEDTFETKIETLSNITSNIILYAKFTVIIGDDGSEYFNENIDLTSVLGTNTLDDFIYINFVATHDSYIDELKLIEIDTGNEIDLIQSITNGDGLATIYLGSKYTIADNIILFNVSEGYASSHQINIYINSTEVSKYTVKISGYKNDYDGSQLSSLTIRTTGSEANPKYNF